MSARVLVVDDVLPNVKLLEAKLTREYFDVITAFNGPEALDAAVTHAPDIILLDVMMPGMDGFEVCSRLRAMIETRHIPIVMVTALSDTADRVRGLQAGADDFLTKPVNDVALFARVRSLVRLKMMMDEWRIRQHTSGEFGVLEESGSEWDEAAEGARVLVVEDSPVDQTKIVDTLKRDSATVQSTEDIRSAIDLSSQSDFELVIISLTLLEEDGLRLCSQLRSQDRSRQTPILLLADDGDEARTAKGLELGANDYLVKPIDRNELQARARTQIRRKRYQDRLRSNYEQSLSMALTDSLTGMFNRRYLSSHLKRVLVRIRDTQKPVSAIIFDIDFFKRVNDTFGHAAGDEVLREIANRVSRNLRNFDTVARMGGEEFVIIMPEATIEAAAMVAERLRLRICDEPFELTEHPPQTISISLGIAVTDNPDEVPDALLRRADLALYAAKARGRNRVVTEDELDQDVAAVGAG